MPVEKIKIRWISCHKNPNRSFFWKGKQLPVCARCTGIHIGYLSLFLFLFQLIYIHWVLSIILILPTLIDGLTQAYFNRESTNTIRFTSGVLAGLGIMSIIHIIGFQIGYFILDILTQIIYSKSFSNFIILFSKVFISFLMLSALQND